MPIRKCAKLKCGKLPKNKSKFALCCTARVDLANPRTVGAINAENTELIEMSNKKAEKNRYEI